MLPFASMETFSMLKQQSFKLLVSSFVLTFSLLENKQEQTVSKSLWSSPLPLLSKRNSSRLWCNFQNSLSVWNTQSLLTKLSLLKRRINKSLINYPYYYTSFLHFDTLQGNLLYQGIFHHPKALQHILLFCSVLAFC